MQCISSVPLASDLGPSSCGDSNSNSVLPTIPQTNSMISAEATSENWRKHDDFMFDSKQCHTLGQEEEFVSPATVDTRYTSPSLHSPTLHSDIEQSLDLQVAEDSPVDSHPPHSNSGAPNCSTDSAIEESLKRVFASSGYNPAHVGFDTCKPEFAGILSGLGGGLPPGILNPFSGGADSSSGFTQMPNFPLTPQSFAPEKPAGDPAQPPELGHTASLMAHFALQQRMMNERCFGQGRVSSPFGLPGGPGMTNLDVSTAPLCGTNQLMNVLTTCPSTDGVDQSPARHPSRFYKTKICPYLQQKGKCSKGVKCVYAHSFLELRGLPNLEKTKLCPAYKADGVCRMANCQFAHAVEELRHTDNFYKTKLCHMWKKGKCVAGTVCRHAHGAEELKWFRTVSRQTAPSRSPSMGSTVVPHRLQRSTAAPQPIASNGFYPPSQAQVRPGNLLDTSVFPLDMINSEGAVGGLMFPRNPNPGLWPPHFINPGAPTDDTATPGGALRSPLVYPQGSLNCLQAAASAMAVQTNCLPPNFTSSGTFQFPRGVPMCAADGTTPPTIDNYALDLALQVLSAPHANQSLLHIPPPDDSSLTQSTEPNTSCRGSVASAVGDGGAQRALSPSTSQADGSFKTAENLVDGCDTAESTTTPLDCVSKVEGEEDSLKGLNVCDAAERCSQTESISSKTENATENEPGTLKSTKRRSDDGSLAPRVSSPGGSLPQEVSVDYIQQATTQSLAARAQFLQSSHLCEGLGPACSSPSGIHNDGSRGEPIHPNPTMTSPVDTIEASQQSMFKSWQEQLNFFTMLQHDPAMRNAFQMMQHQSLISPHPTSSDPTTTYMTPSSGYIATPMYPTAEDSALHSYKHFSGLPNPQAYHHGMSPNSLVSTAATSGYLSDQTSPTSFTDSSILKEPHSGLLQRPNFPHLLKKQHTGATASDSPSIDSAVSGDAGDGAFIPSPFGNDNGLKYPDTSPNNNNNNNNNNTTTTTTPTEPDSTPLPFSLAITAALNASKHAGVFEPHSPSSQPSPTNNLM